MEELIQQQFKVIPETLKMYLQSDTLFEDIEEILKDQPLQNVQKDSFTFEVTMVLLRLESSEMFTANIKKGMEIAMKRAEIISRRTNEIIFEPLEEYMLDFEPDAFGESTEVPKTKISDVIPMKPKLISEEKNQIHHSAIAPKVVASEIREPNAKEKVLSSPDIPQKPSNDSQDIFKKRLEQPVHTPVEENQIGDSKKINAQVDPNVKEAIEKDPYKESF